MKNLIKAVLSVMAEVKGMEKNSRVGAGGNAYNGTKYQDVAEIFNDAMVKNELCMVPTDIEESTEVKQWMEVDPWSKSTPKDMKQKQSIFTKVKTKYLLCHSSGETMVICGYGHGVDPQDKAAGKATTYALKNALLYTFLTPVGKMDDTDNTHSNDIPTPPPPETKKEKPKTIWLTSDQYDKALLSTSKGITATINAFSKPGYSMKLDYKTKLLEKLKELNTSK